jgi:hypothetical protein
LIGPCFGQMLVGDGLVTFFSGSTRLAETLFPLNLAKEFWLIIYAIGRGLGRFEPLKLMNRCVNLMRTTLQLDEGALRTGLPQLPVEASDGVVS